MSVPVNRYRPSTQQRGEDTRRRILDTALALFAAEGFSGASTREIAERAGVNLPAIQYYFGSKEGLYRAVIAHIGEQLAEMIAPIAARARDCLASGTPPRNQVIDLLCELITALVAMFLDETLPNRENCCLFVARVEVEDTEALDTLHEIWREHVQMPAAGLVGFLMGRASADDEVIIRTLMILGQIKVFCSRATMRGLGWQSIGQARIQTVQTMAGEHTRAICRALKGTA